MQRFSSIFAVAFVGAFGLWGCSPTPVANPSSERVRSLESKLQTATENRDLFASKLKAAEAKNQSIERELVKLQAQLDGATRERDDAKAMTRIRTAERDLSQSQYDTFRKSLKEMLGQAESAELPPRFEGAVLSGPALPVIR